jgi:hypothetical protein
MIKEENGKFNEKEFEGFSFVPIIKGGLVREI